MSLSYIHSSPSSFVFCSSVATWFIFGASPSVGCLSVSIHRSLWSVRRYCKEISLDITTLCVFFRIGHSQLGTPRRLWLPNWMLCYWDIHMYICTVVSQAIVWVGARGSRIRNVVPKGCSSVNGTRKYPSCYREHPVRSRCASNCGRGKRLSLLLPCTIGIDLSSRTCLPAWSWSRTGLWRQNRSITLDNTYLCWRPTALAFAGYKLNWFIQSHKYSTACEQNG